VNRWKQLLHSPWTLGCLCLVALLPTLFCLLRFFSSQEELQLLEGRVAAISAHKMFLSRAKAQEADRLEKLKGADPAYLEKELESLRFLEPETRRLQLLEKNGPRLHFLKDGGNVLRLVEQNFRKKPPFQEADVHLEHGIEMDTEDLKRLLLKVEGVQAPELTFLTFQLSKKPLSEGGEVFLVQFKLMKRELVR